MGGTKIKSLQTIADRKCFRDTTSIFNAQSHIPDQIWAGLRPIGMKSGGEYSYMINVNITCYFVQDKRMNVYDIKDKSTV